MKRLLAILVLAALAALSAQASEMDARKSFDAGLRAFNASNFSAAYSNFIQAADLAPSEGLDPSLAKHNARIAATKAEDPVKASEAAAPQRLATEFYNCGNIEFKLADDSKNTVTNLDMQEKHIEKAIGYYEKSIELDPAHTNAKANYELAVLKQQQIQQQKQQQQQNQDQQKQDQQQKQEEQPDQKQDQQQKQQAEQQPRPQPQSQDNQKQEEQIQEEKPSEEMTPEEAAMMLDAMKAQEQSLRDQLHPFFGRPVPVEKDW